jgi:protein-tyrosine sulfotransferase
MANNLKKSELLCAKDPYLTSHLKRINQMFPKSKMVLMVRDGRATSYSYIRKHKANVDESFFDYLKRWNDLYIKAYSECQAIGPLGCKLVKYEDLIQNTKEVMESVSKFLGIEFTENFLNHEKYIGSKVVVAPGEWSSSQVKKPIYTDSLTPWVGKVKYDKQIVSKQIKMLASFNYTL